MVNVVTHNYFETKNSGNISGVFWKGLYAFSRDFREQATTDEHLHLSLIAPSSSHIETTVTLIARRGKQISLNFKTRNLT